MLLLINWDDPWQLFPVTQILTVIGKLMFAERARRTETKSGCVVCVYSRFWKILLYVSVKSFILSSSGTFLFDTLDLGLNSSS